MTTVTKIEFAECALKEAIDNIVDDYASRLVWGVGRRELQAIREEADSDDSMSILYETPVGFRQQIVQLSGGLASTNRPSNVLPVYDLNGNLLPRREKWETRLASRYFKQQLDEAEKRAGLS